MCVCGGGGGVHEGNIWPAAYIPPKFEISGVLSFWLRRRRRRRRLRRRTPTLLQAITLS